jgi:hypothetical protein
MTTPIDPSALYGDTGSSSGCGMMSFLTAADAMHHLHARHLLFSQSNLVSDDQPGHLNAQIQDTNLINPWGVAFSPNSPFWVSNNHTGTSTLYSVDPATDTTTAVPLVVTIAPPAGGTGPASPTGIVFNDDQSGFLVNGTPASFIFATEGGTISAWAGGTTSTLEVDNSADPAHGDDTVPPDEGIGAVYKGLAIGTANGTTLLYTTNFRHGTVDVFNDRDQHFPAGACCVALGSSRSTSEIASVHLAKMVWNPECSARNWGWRDRDYRWSERVYPVKEIAVNKILQTDLTGQEAVLESSGHKFEVSRGINRTNQIQGRPQNCLGI